MNVSLRAGGFTMACMTSPCRCEPRRRYLSRLGPRLARIGMTSGQTIQHNGGNQKLETASDLVVSLYPVATGGYKSWC
jgi:hypothetical protein